MTRDVPTAAELDPSLAPDEADTTGTATTDEPVEGEASTGPTPRAGRARKTTED